MCIPIRGQYEQLCNAAALKKLGVTILDDADTDHFASDILQWLSSPQCIPEQDANNVMDTLQFLLDTYPKYQPKLVSI
jgi:hypothetical protein